MTVSILGTRVIRTEDPRFLTTGGVYTDDMRLPGACHVHFVRSAVAHARIRSVDVSAALEAPGVIAAFTGADLTDLPPAPPPMPGMINAEMSQPLLATDTVRYVGEPLAVVVTEHRYQGEDAADLVDVDYEMLPALVDMAEAESSPTVLFPAAGSNVAASFGDRSALAADLFDGCEVVVSRTIVNQRVAPAPMETRAAVASWDEGGRLTAWIPNQGAQGTKGALAGMLGIDPATLRVVTPDVGGAFGAKFGADPEHVVVAWAARELGHPVRWTETRFENLVAMTHGRAQEQTVTIGGLRDGTVLAYRLEVLQDAGAYPRLGAILPSLTILMAPGPTTSHGPRPSPPPWSPTPRRSAPTAARGGPRPRRRWSGPWTCSRPRSGWTRRGPPPEPAAPVHRAARDRLRRAVRQRRLRGRAGPVLKAAGYDELRREQAERRARGDVVQLGIGLASYVEITGPGAEEGGPRENATVEVHPDGGATILTGTSPHGQGHVTVWAMLASDELGIPVDKITVKWGDTDLIPEGGGTGGSRSLQQGGAAVQQASRELLDVARRRAASRWRPTRTTWFSTPGAARSRWRATRTPRYRWPGSRSTSRLLVRARVQRARPDVPVRGARGRGRGGHRDRQGGAAPGGHRG